MAESSISSDDEAHEPTDSDEFNQGVNRRLSLRRVTPKLLVREAFYKTHAQRTTPKFSQVKSPRKRGTPKLAEYEGVCKRMLLDSHDDSSTDDEETPTEMTRRQQQNVLILERRLHEKTQDSYSESDSEDDHVLGGNQPKASDFLCASSEGNKSCKLS